MIRMLRDEALTLHDLAACRDTLWTHLTQGAGDNKELTDDVQPVIVA
jgi:hypothetical protein